MVVVVPVCGCKRETHAPLQSACFFYTRKAGGGGDFAGWKRLAGATAG